MSWDILIYTTDPRQLTGDAEPPPLGDAAEVRAKISKVLPKVDWSDPAWGLLDSGDWSIEFNHRTNGVSDTLMLHVRGGGNPLPSITAMCKSNGWVALDCSNAELIDLDAPSTKSWQEFQGFRDGILATVAEKQKLRSNHDLYWIGGILLVLVILFLAWKRR